jgi:hypothetical protein
MMEMLGFTGADIPDLIGAFAALAIVLFLTFGVSILIKMSELFGKNNKKPQDEFRGTVERKMKP